MLGADVENRGGLICKPMGGGQAINYSQHFSRAKEYDVNILYTCIYMGMDKYFCSFCMGEGQATTHPEYLKPYSWHCMQPMKFTFMAMG